MPLSQSHGDDAEDATQEALLKIVTRLSTFRRESRFSTWAWSVAARSILDFKRGRARAPQLSFEDFEADLARDLDLTTSPRAEDAVYLAQVKIGCARAMLQCLDGDHRVAYVLGEILGLDQREAARALGVSDAAFRKRLARARERVSATVRRACGLVNDKAPCRCHRRLVPAQRLGRIDERNRSPLNGWPQTREVTTPRREVLRSCISLEAWMLRLWGRLSAFNVQKVLWTLAELGLDHEWIDAGGAAGGLDKPEFLAMNPHGRIPVIDDGGVTLWESHAIIRYLACRYGEGTLWADDAAERSYADRWMDWSQCTLQRDCLELFWALVRTPPHRRDRAFIDARGTACRGDYELLDRWLAERLYLSGDRFTMADIPAGATLYRYFEMDLDHPDVPNVRSWYERLQRRDAYREQIMRPFDDLRGRLEY